jgi:hypothetical protein
MRVVALNGTRLTRRRCEVEKGRRGALCQRDTVRQALSQAHQIFHHLKCWLSTPCRVSRAGRPINGASRPTQRGKNRVPRPSDKCHWVHPTGWVPGPGSSQSGQMPSLPGFLPRPPRLKPCLQTGPSSGLRRPVSSVSCLLSLVPSTSIIITYDEVKTTQLQTPPLYFRTALRTVPRPRSHRAEPPAGMPEQHG